MSSSCVVGCDLQRLLLAGMAGSLRISYGVASPVDILSDLYTASACDERRLHAQAVAESHAAGNGPSAARHLRWKQPARHQLVYGEFEVDLFARVLQAAKVREGDVFCDIGSGAGRLVLAAALLHPTKWRECIGIEVLSEHHDRAEEAARALKLQQPTLVVPQLTFLCADVFDPRGEAMLEMLQRTDVAMAYAITWAAADGHLTALSALLGATLHDGARVITVELRLLSTPRLHFHLIHSETGWNEDTGESTCFVFRASVQREPVLVTSDVEDASLDEEPQRVGREPSGLKAIDDGRRCRLVPHVFVTVTRSRASLRYGDEPFKSSRAHGVGLGGFVVRLELQVACRLARPRRNEARDRHPTSHQV